MSVVEAVWTLLLFSLAGAAVYLLLVALNIVVGLIPPEVLIGELDDVGLVNLVI